MLDRDLDRNPLGHLGEVSRGVVGRNEGEELASGRPNFEDLPFESSSRIGVDRDPDRIAEANPGHLRLLEVGQDPDIGHVVEGDDRLARLDNVPLPSPPLGHLAPHSCDDDRLFKFNLGEAQLGLARRKVQN